MTLQTGFTVQVWLAIPIVALVAVAPLFSLGLLIRNANPGRATQSS